METVIKLAEFATKLTEAGFMSLAGDVDAIANDIVLVGKELGGQGYWVQNSRCWQGCYRNKRASSPKTPVDKIVTQCMEEYQEAISGKNVDWDKYAENNSTSMIKTASAANRMQFAYFDGAERLFAVAEKIKGELSTEATVLADQLYREAQIGNFFRGLPGWGKQKMNDVGQWAGDKLQQGQDWVADKANQVGNAVGNAVRDVNARGAGLKMSNDLKKAYQTYSQSVTAFNTTVQNIDTQLVGFLKSKSQVVQGRAAVARGKLSNLKKVTLSNQKNIDSVVADLAQTMAGLDGSGAAKTAKPPTAVTPTATAVPPTGGAGAGTTTAPSTGTAAA